MSLDKYTQTRLVVLHPDTTVYTAVRAMQDNHVGAILVHDGSALVGIVTDRDLALKVLSEDDDPLELELRSVMSSPVMALPVSATESDVADVMLAGHVRRIAIMDGQALVGIVSLDDLILERSVPVALLAAIVRAQLSDPAKLKARGRIRPVTSGRCSAGALNQRRAERQAARAKQAYEQLVWSTLVATGLERRVDAENALDAVVSSLIRRIQPEERAQLLAQLPRLLIDRLASAAAGPDRQVTLAELEWAIEVRLQVGRPRAAELVRQVGGVLEQALGGGELEDVRSQLPQDMKQILGRFVPLTNEGQRRRA